MKRRRKRCSSMKPRHKSKSSASSSSSSWSDDLGVDLLREINKKLCNYGDHIRFRGVCKSWRAVGQDLKRAGDVLPWLTGIHIDYNMKKLSYKLNEPRYPIKPHTTITTTISHTINLGDYFDYDISNRYYYYSTASRIRYVDGWLHISVYNYKSKSFSFLFFSLATKSSFTLPQLNDCAAFPMHLALSADPDSPAFPMYLALSAAPDSPDCVFLALHITSGFTRTIGIFRHGDTHWTTTKSVKGWFDKPRDKAVVFIRGVFYFILTLGIGSYDLDTGRLKVYHFSTMHDLDTGRLKVYHFSTMLASSTIHSFFGLDGDLMLAYYKPQTPKLFCISKYDWSTKVWVPLQSLAGRSLYLTRHSVYVDRINYYGISGANKIYVQDDTTSCVDEYTLEDGQLLKRPSTGLRNRCGPSSYMALDIWVDPPDVLLRKG